MEILNTLRRINDENFVGWVESDFTDLRNLLTEYGYADDSQIPWWFARIFNDVHAKQKDYFLYYDTDARRSDMGSILIELAARFKWNVDDYGEGAVLLFPHSRIRVFISREASDSKTGKSCYSVEVSRLE